MIKKLNNQLEQKAATLEESKQELTYANETQEKLFSIISHDLRSPINALMNLLLLIKNGDIITIDAETSELSVDLSEEEIIARRKNWKPREHEYGSGEIWKYSQLVGSALKGAVTHPGAKKEKHCFADT